MTAPALNMRELSFDEINNVSGGDGFFERLGEALQNPLVTAGRLIDQVIHESRNSTASDFGTSGAYVTAKVG